MKTAKLNVNFLNENTAWIIKILPLAKNIEKFKYAFSEYIQQTNNNLTHIEALFFKEMIPEHLKKFEITYTKYSNEYIYNFNLSNLLDSFERNFQIFSPKTDIKNFDLCLKEIMNISTKDIINNYFIVRKDFKNLWAKLSQSFLYYINTLFIIKHSSVIKRKGNLISVIYKPNNFYIKSEDKPFIFKINKEMLIPELTISYIYRIKNVYYITKKSQKNNKNIKNLKSILNAYKLNFINYTIADYIDMNYQDNIFILDTDVVDFYKKRISYHKNNILYW